MIHPNIIIFQYRPSELKTRKSLDVTEIPSLEPSTTDDRGTIDHIRNQPKPNEIAKYTTSDYKEDIKYEVEIEGAYCQVNPIAKVVGKIRELHETLNDKEPPEIKGWVRRLTGLHPDIDKQIKTLGYWDMPFSEVIGTNTILYYPGLESVDITGWAKKPKFLDNEIEWFTEPWEAPHYIRESVRQKLDSPVVEFIQNANHVTTKSLRRNLIWEALITTKKESGGETKQSRPIKPEVPEINHGVSLNNDWYHQTYRIMDGEKMDKHVGKHDAICHLTSGGYYVHLLVNHLTPLTNAQQAQSMSTRLASPLGVEDTFPRHPINPLDVDNSGQPVLKTPTAVNNDILKPEIITGE